MKIIGMCGWLMGLKKSCKIETMIAGTNFADGDCSNFLDIIITAVIAFSEDKSLAWLFGNKCLMLP